MALSIAQNEEDQLNQKLKEIKLEEIEKATEQKAAGLGYNYINLVGFSISEDALKTIGEEKAKEEKIICFFKIGLEARIGVVDAENQEMNRIIEELKTRDFNVKIYLISEHSLQSALTAYARLPKIKSAPKGLEITEDDLNKFKDKIKNFRDLEKEIKNVSITDLMTLIIASAIKADASDIHIEAEENGIKIRFRLDGILYDAAVLDKELWKKVISRIKLLSGLKINITANPQNGRFTIFLSKDKIDVRVSCLPTAYGESVVMRLLMSSATGLAFADLGLQGRAFEQLKKEIKRPNGMIITTGPTGSGKTTTLYAVLNELNKPGIKIITLENPIEYKLKGINQSQIEESKNYTFAEGLKNILRQDPDIVMVGEIRDLETAETAINAALTGHLVISTLHTNSAAASVPRFLAMGVKPFLLSPALNAVIGQRLVRKICLNCKEEINLEPDILKRVKDLLSQIPENSGYQPDLNNLKFYMGKGCDQCNGLGYKGRIGIYEVMLMVPEIAKMILENNVSDDVLQQIAIKNGMITMAQDGLLKATNGITSVDEVFRVAE